MYIIQFGITPEGGSGRADLPVEVETWLVATQICLSKIQEESTASAAK